MKQIEVVAGIIKHDNKILCVQKADHIYEYLSHKFEFPGGKIEKGETKEGALARELYEELSITAELYEPFLTVEYSYPDFELTMHSFVCKVLTKKVKLNEHIAFEWLPVNKIRTLDWAAADVPIVEKLVVNG